MLLIPRSPTNQFSPLLKGQIPQIHHQQTRKVFSNRNRVRDSFLRWWKIYYQETLTITTHLKDMDVSENSGTPQSSILIGFSNINHPFWGTPNFGNTHMHMLLKLDHFPQNLGWSNNLVEFGGLFLGGLCIILCQGLSSLFWEWKFSTFNRKSFLLRI